MFDEVGASAFFSLVWFDDEVSEPCGVVVGYCGGDADFFVVLV